MKKIIVFLSITFMAGIAFVSMYNSIIDTTIWISDIPDSIVLLRMYFRVTSPHDFFKVFSPINQVLALFTLILFWKTSKKAKLFFMLAFLLNISINLITFFYVFPRTSMLMNLPVPGNTIRFTEALQQWRMANWIRTTMVLMGLLLSCLGLNEIYKCHRIKLPKSGIKEPSLA